METIVILHGRLANTVWIYLLILGLWSLLRAIRGEGLSGNFLGALIIAQVLIYIQAILGGFLFLGGQSSNLLVAGNTLSLCRLFSGFFTFRFSILAAWRRFKPWAVGHEFCRPFPIRHHLLPFRTILSHLKHGYSKVRIAG